MPGEPRVEICEGTAFEVLLGAAAVADENWRDVFSRGPAVHQTVLSALGPGFVERVAALGRFGWINLIGLLTRAAQPWDLDRLIAMATQTSPEDLHYVAIGGDRRQLLEAVEESVIRAAVRGDHAAQERLTAALASDSHVLEATPWLVTTRSGAVRAAILEILQAWRETLYPPAAEAAAAAAQHEHAVAARGRLAETTSRAFLAEAIGGLDYGPAGLDRLLSVSTPAVAPIVVVVDGRQETVILHPPLVHPPLDADSRLLELGRAVGDRTRIRLLALMRDHEMTAVDLAQALRAPRTTLLHHLAILRSAGVVHVTVAPGGATVYRLRPEGFADLAAAAAGFIPTE